MSIAELTRDVVLHAYNYFTSCAINNFPKPNKMVKKQNLDRNEIIALEESKLL